MSSITRLGRNSPARGQLFRPGKEILYVVLILLGFDPSSYAGFGTQTGEEPGLWDQGGYAVVVATIHDIKMITGNVADGYHATLELRASLCGNLDPSQQPTLKVGFECQTLTTSIRQLPADGATVIAVVMGEDGRAGILSDYCDFMPGRSSLVTVSGLNDPIVLETLKRLQAARKARAAKAAAATQPSAPG
jgi:hypothetical protein